jgi:hypothetical protein
MLANRDDNTCLGCLSYTDRLNQIGSDAGAASSRWRSAADATYSWGEPVVSYSSVRQITLSDSISTPGADDVGTLDALGVYAPILKCHQPGMLILIIMHS